MLSARALKCVASAERRAPFVPRMRAGDTQRSGPRARSRLVFSLEEFAAGQAIVRSAQGRLNHAVDRKIKGETFALSLEAIFDIEFRIDRAAAEIVLAQPVRVIHI